MLWSIAIALEILFSIWRIGHQKNCQQRCSMLIWSFTFADANVKLQINIVLHYMTIWHCLIFDSSTTCPSILQYTNTHTFADRFTCAAHDITTTQNLAGINSYLFQYRVGHVPSVPSPWWLRHFFNLWTTSTVRVRCDVYRHYVLRHRSPYAGVLMQSRCRSIADHRSRRRFL